MEIFRLLADCLETNKEPGEWTKRLKLRRSRLGLTLRQFGAAWALGGYSPSTVCNIENGRKPWSSCDRRLRVFFHLQLLSLEQRRALRSALFLLLDWLRPAAHIGIDVSPAYKCKFPQHYTSGLLVWHVQEDSAAAASGLVVDDVLLDFNEQPLRTAEDLASLLDARRPGDNVRVMVLREGMEHPIDIRPRPRPR